MSSSIDELSSEELEEEGKRQKRKRITERANRFRNGVPKNYTGKSGNNWFWSLVSRFCFETFDCFPQKTTMFRHHRDRESRQNHLKKWVWRSLKLLLVNKIEKSKNHREVSMTDCTKLSKWNKHSTSFRPMLNYFISFLCSRKSSVWRELMIEKAIRAFKGYL